MEQNMEMIETGGTLNQTVASVIDEVERVIIGKRNSIKLAVVALLCGGHAIVEDVPGVGKTMMVKTLAKTIGCEFTRIQFTPDLLPSDVTGVSIYNLKTQEFEYRPGPIVGNIVLADEINRTSPKTQAALLEALEEGTVTVDGQTRPLPSPFFVMATQNPIEYEGTFPLPEAQLDRFMLKIALGYPSADEERQMLERQQTTYQPINMIRQVISGEDIVKMQQQVRQVHIDSTLHEYIVSLVRATREHGSVWLGVSPRGAIALMRAAQGLAFTEGRTYVLPDDVKVMVPAVFGHRIILKGEARMAGVTDTHVLTDVISTIGVPIVKRG